jgi:hypothetical protein
MYKNHVLYPRIIISWPCSRLFITCASLVLILSKGFVLLYPPSLDFILELPRARASHRQRAPLGPHISTDLLRFGVAGSGTLRADSCNLHHPEKPQPGALLLEPFNV